MDKEYQMLRSAALKIIEELGIEGGCNCQFALNPDSFEYAVIEVNPRVSPVLRPGLQGHGVSHRQDHRQNRPGYTLDEIKNDVTGETYACFEPSVDYVVVKFPKWPFDKFHGASRKLGSQMKATGEVMSIEHTFEAALMKAVRGAEIKLDSLRYQDTTGRSLDERLASMDDLRLFTIFEALTQGVSIDHIHEITKIDKFFIHKLQNLVRFEESLKGGITPETYLQGKKYGYPDKVLARLAGVEEASLPHRFPQLQDGGHLRRRVPGSNPLLLRHLRRPLRRPELPAAGRRPSSSWGPAPSASARASSLTTAPSTACRP